MPAKRATRQWQRLRPLLEPGCLADFVRYFAAVAAPSSLLEPKPKSGEREAEVLLEEEEEEEEALPPSHVSLSCSLFILRNRCRPY